MANKKDKEKTKHMDRPKASAFFKKNIPQNRDTSPDRKEEEEQDTIFNMSDISSMLADIKSVFKSEIRDAVTKITDQITELGERTTRLENKSKQQSESTQKISKRVDNHSSRMTYLENKVEDLENRSRRDNLKLRGIPDNILDLDTYTKELFTSVLPEIPQRKFTLDRIHRIGPKQTDPKKSRDVLLKLHHPEIKYKILQKAREAEKGGLGIHKIQIFPDVAQITVEKRRKLKPITATLRSHEIPYKWGFPFALIFFIGNKKYQVNNLEDGMELLNRLSLTQEENMETTKHGEKDSTENWTEVRSRKKPRETQTNSMESPPKSYRRISNSEEDSEHQEEENKEER